MFHGVLQILASTEESGGIAALGIDPWALLAQGFTFLLLLFLIQKFALRKIVSTLEERRVTINRGVKYAHEMDQLKADLDARVEMALKAARVDADKIIAEAHNEAGGVIRAAEESAGKKADALLRDAEAKIERDIIAARSELRSEVAQLVAAATEVVLDEKIDAKRDSTLIDRAIKEAA